MDYFKILNLNKEPFSNSPEPEFFFPSPRHVACLQQLELAIRLKRGLNVVMGDVGTGKSTLCRQLIRRLTESEEDRNDIQTYLVLDPSFTDSHEFLTAVSATFGLPRTAGTESEWQLKENIKDHLFRQGVDEKKIIVLIIDEGQKLPVFCLEILREFLNYETNDSKLLQIVIFAQTEFKEILKSRENLADRVNQNHFIRPLNFRETRALIRFRIAHAGRPDGMRSFFTLPALWAIHRATGGYPRKIITLCHQSLLTLIIQNRVRAGRRMVQATAERLLPVVLREKRWARAGVLAILTAVVLLFVVFFSDQPNYSRNASLTAITDASPTPSVAAQAVSLPLIIVAGQPPEIAAKPAPALPDGLGSLKIHESGTALRLLRDIYGPAGTSRFQALVKANPHIRDLNRARAGEIIHFPAIPTSPPPFRSGKRWMQVAEKKSLEEAYAFYMEYPGDGPAINVIPAWSQQTGLSFLIILKRGFYSENGAVDAFLDLPPGLSGEVKILKPPAEDKVFFASLPTS